MIRVVLCDILPVVLSGLTDILRGADGIEIAPSCIMDPCDDVAQMTARFLPHPL